MRRVHFLFLLFAGLSALIHPPLHAELAVAWDDTTGAYGLAVNAPNGPDSIGRALNDCRAQGGGNGCRILSNGDLRGFGAIYESCSGRVCVQGASAGHDSRQAAHAAARERCQVNHRVPVCWPLVDWEEFGISELPPAEPSTASASKSASRRFAGASIDTVLEAAGDGDAEAAYLLGQLAIAQGALSHARQWFTQAAREGDVDGRAQLGVFLLYGIGGEAVPMEAAHWLAAVFPDIMRLPEPDPHLPPRYRRLELRAYAGGESAQAALGYLYREGRNGVTRDGARSAFWLERAALAGDIAAQGLLGIDRYVGQPGVPPDRAQGFAWIKRSANQGFAPAQAFLGVILETRGWRDQAVVQFRRAAAQGDAMAIRKLETLGLPVDAR